MTDDGAPDAPGPGDPTAGARHVNRLARETSPYLRSHAHNPVDWYPWGPEALERARVEARPILLSIGYAACHWCHVMERESFEDEETARLMNASFVCIKVDREERPDLDEIYMAATVAMNGSGGWPMTVFLTPDQRPFFAGTYFPPEDRYGRPGFRSLLEQMSALWRERRGAVMEQAEELTELLQQASLPSPPAPVSAVAIEEAVLALHDAFEPTHGGFSRAPKFPPCASLSLLLRHHRRTGDAQSLHMVQRTLDGMKDGGMYDHLGGGFARYSTDDRWLVPHFEKMLYDNAALARVYLEAYQVTGEHEYRRVVEETLEYVLADMQDPGGGYYSATDADSEGVEGKYFVWSRAEIVERLGDRARPFLSFYGVTEEGNWEGTNVLCTPRTHAEVAAELGLDVDALAAELAWGKATLLAARRERVAPLLDDKVLVSWNALMLGTMAEAGRVLGEPRYVDSARRAAAYVRDHMTRPDGGLYRTARAGVAHLAAYLEDYAFLVDGLTDLYEATFEPAHLAHALSLARRMVADFSDEAGGAFFHTAKGHEALVCRMRDGHDGALPSPNAIAARALLRLSHHLDLDDLREVGLGALRAYGRAIAELPRAFASTLCAAELALEGPVELAVVGPAGDPATEVLWAELGRHFLPNRIIARADPALRAPDHPLLRGKTLVDGVPALYVCRDHACEAPITRPADAAESLRRDGVAASARRAASVRASARAAASVDATAAWAASHPLGPAAYGPLGRTGLTVSRVGFGAHRVTGADATHRAALERALDLGINLVDTAAHFGRGASERLVGDVLSEQIARGALAREAVVIVSKLGYAAGADLRAVERRAAHREPYPGVLSLEEGGALVYAPAFLEQQLARTLSRLAVDTLDVCLLHAPERLPSSDRTAALRGAFAYLEREVARGRVGCYGVVSERASVTTVDDDVLSLESVLAAARDAGGADHHLRVLELPFNLMEVEAARADGALAWAATHDLAVLACRPLNALVEGHLVRLAERAPEPSGPPLQGQLDLLEELEDEYLRSFARLLRTAPGSGIDPGSFFQWSAGLRELAGQDVTVEHVEEIEGQLIVPQVESHLAMLDRAIAGPLAELWERWRDRYAPTLSGALSALRRRAAAASVERLALIRAHAKAEVPEALRAEPLARQALYFAAASRGVCAVLSGMRRPTYVEDAAAVLRALTP